ncbi:MAG: hypothetical protein K2P52_06600, partial [Campylobacterales bacterium]|nr:hypothetical protein [Campylobacterales bacterium]
MAQEESKSIKYLNNKVQIKEKAPVGENIAIYVRPGDKIDLESLGINLENAKFKLIGGDIVLEMPGAGNYTFVSLALMGYGENTPEFIGQGGKVTSLSTILSNIEEINALPINSIVTNEFVNLPDASEQDKKNKANEEKKNEATPQVIVIDNSVAMDDNISQSLAENTAQFMDRSIEESVINTNISMKTDTNKAKATKTEDAAVEGVKPSLTFDINVEHVKSTSEFSGEGVDKTLIVKGGGGNIYANDYPNSPALSELQKQTNAEDIDYRTVNNSIANKSVINADNNDFFGNTFTSRLINLSPSQPLGFGITTIKISGIPSIASIVGGTKVSDGVWIINKAEALINGFTIDPNNGSINFVIKYDTQLTEAKNFTMNIEAQSVWDITNVPEYLKLDAEKPLISDLTFNKSYGMNIKEVDVNAPLSYKYTPVGGNKDGFVLATNLNDNIIRTGDIDTTVIGGVTQDTIYAQSGNDTLYGNEGNDTIAPGLGNDTVDGGAGNDTVSYSNFAVSNVGAGVVVNLTTQSATGSGNDTLISIENIIGSDFRDTLIGSIGINTIRGGGGNDTIDGKEGNDTLFGEAGNDLFKSGFGDNYIDGGTGNNTVDYSQVTDLNGVIVKLLSPTAVGLGETWGESTSNSGNDRLVNIQNVIGTQYDDTFSGADNTNNSFDGGVGGSDLVDYSYYKSNAITVNLDEGWATGQGTDSFKNIDAIRGTDILAFGDTLIGSSTQGNTLYGMAGNDIIKGMGGNNSLYGGSGNDTIYSGKNDDFIDGGTGVDTVSYEDINTGGVTVYLGKENIPQNTINAGNDTLKNIQNLIGTVFNDTLGASLTEVNTLNGLGGNDTADYSVLLKAISDAGVIANLLLGTASKGLSTDDTLISIENLIGTDGKDTLIGNNSNNILDGGKGNDYFISYGGNNSIIGGEGIDTLDYSQSGKSLVIENLDIAGTVKRGTGSAQEIDELSSIEKIIGTSSKDIIKANATSTVNFEFQAGSGNDTLQGGAGNDILSGESGDDYFYASGGIDDIDGGNDGEVTGDTVDFSYVANKIELKLAEIGNGTKVLEGDLKTQTHTIINIENITGSLTHENTLAGNSQDNTLIGGNLNDTLSGGNGGTNYLDGGLGVNTVDYSAINTNGTGVTLNLNNTAL